MEIGCGWVAYTGTAVIFKVLFLCTMLVLLYEYFYKTFINIWFTGVLFDVNYTLNDLSALSNHTRWFKYDRDKL
jgi:hypothetical protein